LSLLFLAATPLISSPLTHNSTSVEFLAGSISGLKFYDVNGNGFRDLATDYGLSGWKIKITGAVVDSTITDQDGNYSSINMIWGDGSVSQKKRK